MQPTADRHQVGKSTRNVVRKLIMVGHPLSRCRKCAVPAPALSQPASPPSAGLRVG